MPIIFSVIARDIIILAKHAERVGNFREVVDQVLTQINPHQTSKLTYAHEEYLFHYIYENQLTYMCITDKNFNRTKAFMFLKEIKNRFQATFGERAITALPYAMNSDFSNVLKTQMRYYSENDRIDALSRAQEELDELKDIMVKNIDSLVSRGERLELLVNKTQDLESSSVTFRTTSRSLARKLWWKNVKLVGCIIVFTLLTVYFIGAVVCGGMSWPSCTS